MEIPLLFDIIVIFALSVVVLFVFLKARMPATVGFLLTGVLAGPHGFGLIEAVHEVEILAEIGVVLLLFTIGIEFSLKNLMRVKKSVLIGGFLQVGLTIAAVAMLVNGVTDFGPRRSVFLGFLLALSSTAIVLKVLQQKAQIDAPHGRLSLSVLIFQDIAVVPMMLAVPYLAGGSAGGNEALWVLGVKAIGILVFVGVSAKWLAPAVLYQLAKTRSREVFLLAVLLICFGVAGLTNKLGLSLALGAFLAGLIISESEYSHQTLGNVLPFGDVFTGLFFVSIGMLLDVRYLAANPLLVAGVTVSVLAVKGIIVFAAAMALGAPIRTAVAAGLALCQIGEFSFILSMTGTEHGLMKPDTYQLFLAVAVMTMGLTPFLIAAGPGAGRLFSKLPMPGRLREGLYVSSEMKPEETEHLSDHLIVAGYGLNGRNVIRAAKAAGIDHIVIEMNPETVQVERGAGENVFYGDVCRESVLEHAGVKSARVMAITIPDPAATRGAVVLARSLNPSLYIIARTRFVAETKPLLELGADVVLPEEFETSVEIFTRVLHRYLVPKTEIERFTAEIRAGGYEMFRSASSSPTGIADLGLNRSGVEIVTVRLEEGTPAGGKTVGQIDLRRKYGVTLLAFDRKGTVVPNPDADTRLESGDVLYMMGDPCRLAELSGWLNPLNPGNVPAACTLDSDAAED